MLIKQSQLYSLNEENFSFTTAILSSSETDSDNGVVPELQDMSLPIFSSSAAPGGVTNRRRLSHRSRRNSIRSKISVSVPAKDSTDLEFLQEYSHSNDLSKRQVNDFKEVSILGIGAYGKVYLVKDIFTGKLYAKKTIKKAKISIDEKLTKNQLNERQILTNIQHPSIVKLFYAFHDNQNINFILEYVPGGEIFYHLANQQRFSEDDTAFYLAEISQALYHLHTVGIVYRDLKPENVLLNADGHVVLTDFGLSSLDEKCHSILGTPQFTAPEVLKGDEYSYPADWWSFGIMMYDMLTGDAPFKGSNRQAIFKKIMSTKKVQIPTFLSSYASDLIRKLLEKDPKKRIQIDKDYNLLKKHRFFRKIDWDNLRNLQPPIEPDTTNLEAANNFDSAYIKTILDQEKKLLDDEEVDFDNEVFQGFSFVANKEFLDQNM